MNAVGVNCVIHKELYIKVATTVMYNQQFTGSQIKSTTLNHIYNTKSHLQY